MLKICHRKLHHILHGKKKKFITWNSLWEHPRLIFPLSMGFLRSGPFRSVPLEDLHSADQLQGSGNLRAARRKAPSCTTTIWLLLNADPL